jgi:hypothetical protein
MVGRIIGVFCCMIGIFILSLFVVAIMHYTLLDAEEEKAYKQIDVVHTQTQENNFITNYFNTYIKYKMWRFKKKKEIRDYFIKKNRYKIVREAHLLKIKASLEKPFDMIEFCDNVRDVWDEEALENKYSIAVNCDKITNSIEPLIHRAQSTLNSGKTSKKYAFKLFNLARLMVNIGTKFEMQSKSYY